MKKLLITLFLIATVLVSHETLTAQNIPANIDFRSIRIDDLSDEQVLEFVKRAENSGLSQTELENMALSRGMRASEITKLRARIQQLSQQNRQPGDTISSESRTVSDNFNLMEKKELPEEETTPDTNKLQIFGHNLFKQDNLTFQPSLNIPTPANYILGAGDQINLEVWGASQQSYSLTVSPEGNIQIPNVGPVRVGGLTIEKASELIINRLSTIYSGLKGAQPNTFAQVSLGNVRTIKVTVAGDASMPGTFTLPPFATAFNALYVASGPAANGSFRNIRIVRNGETISQTDLYDFLLKGETTNNLRLQDEDLIFVEPLQNRVTLSGQVNRPAHYEMKETETLADLMSFAGGFAPGAYSRRLQVHRETETARRILNVEKELFSSFLLQSGDSIHVGEVTPLYDNRVSVRGAVMREGDFALTEGMTVSELVALAEGVREDAFLERAALYRLDNQRRMTVLEVDLKEILNSNNRNIVLQREDMLWISSVDDLREELNVRIIGEVQQQGSYPWAEGITLGEAIRLAGGLNEAASLARVEVARRMSNRTDTIVPQTVTEIFTFAIDQNLSLADEASSFELSPFDIVFVRKSPGYQPQQLVQASGEVNFPGSYAIHGNTEYISDLIERAGGFSADAYLPGASLIRRNNSNRQSRIQRLQSLETGESAILTDSLAEDQQVEYIGIDLEKIIKNPRSQHDLILTNGDILEIPKQLQTVRMTGAVLYPTSAIYQPRRGVRNYIARAGGFAENAMKRKVYVLHPNGSVDRTLNYGLFQVYPEVQPGSEIIVPLKPEREGRTLQETIAISSALTSLALVIVTLINQF